MFVYWKLNVCAIVEVLVISNDLVVSILSDHLDITELFAPLYNGGHNIYLPPHTGDQAADETVDFSKRIKTEKD